MLSRIQVLLIPFGVLVMIAVFSLPFMWTSTLMAHCLLDDVIYCRDSRYVDIRLFIKKHFC